MNIHAFFSLLATAICLVLASVVYAKNSQSAINRLFSYLCLSFSLWSFIEFLIRQSESISRAQLWLDLSVTWPFTVALLMHFVLTYTGAFRNSIPKSIIVFLYSTASLFSALDYLIISNDAIKTYWGWSYQIPESIWYKISTIWAAIIAALALTLVIRHYFKLLPGSGKKQAKYMVFGLTLSVVSGIISEVIFPLLSYKIPELTNTAFAATAVFVGYAIWRYDLFKISPALAADVIVRTMSDALIVVDLERRIELVNPALLELLGYTEKDLLGKGMEIVLGTVQRNEESVTELLRTGVVNDVETTFRKKNGVILPVSLSWALLRDANKKLRGIVFIGRDMTERERTKAALQKARDELEKRVDERTVELTKANDHLRDEILERQKIEERLAAEKELLAITLRSIDDGVITTDTHGAIIMLNKAAEDLTGFTQTDAQGKEISEIYRSYHDDKVTPLSTSEILERLFSSNKNSQAQKPILISSKNNTRQMIVTESSAPLYDKQGNSLGTVIVFKDITEKQFFEEELFKMRKLESISLLARGIAHDFNNILTGIITNLFMAKMGIESNSEPYQIITTAEKAAFRASSLTNQLLTFAREGAPVKVTASIKELIEGSIGFYLSGSKSDYHLNIPDDLAEVEIDRGQIDQVIHNIMVNADQSMPDGGTIEVKAENVDVKDGEILPLKEGRYVKISIKDQGIGIPPENLIKVFDPYFTTKENGTGLGLAISYTVIQKHNGHIAISSQVNKGTEVSIYLPAIIDIEEEKTFSQEEIEDEKSTSAKIMIVDDEEYVRRSAGFALTKLGYETVLAADGDEAVELYKNALANDTTFKAVIFDLTIPGGRGAKETIKELLEIDPKAKVIISSGYANDPTMVQFEQYGFCAAVSKPYNPKELSSVVQSIIKSSIKQESTENPSSVLPA